MRSCFRRTNHIYNVFIAIGTVLILVLVTINNNLFLKKNILKFTDVNLTREVDVSVSCYKNNGKTLPDLSSVSTDWKNSLYFLEVSCRSSKNGRITILPRQACAIESAAFTNPNLNVHLLYASTGVIENQGSLSDHLLEILLSYNNIKLLHVDVENMFSRSIVKSLYEENIVQTSTYPMIVTSDIIRLLLMHYYGGTYLDLDVIVIKNLDTLPINCVAIESTTFVNNAVIRVANDSVGKTFTQACLEDLKNNFSSTVWESTGPMVFTKIMKKMCDLDDLSLMPKANCSNFKILPIEPFYPVMWQDWLKYFETPTSDELLNHILKNSYLVHVWNNVSAGFVASKAPNSIYNTLAERYCPRVYEAAGKYF